jgi:hypothetical protein
MDRMPITTITAIPAWFWAGFEREIFMAGQRTAERPGT